MESADLVLKSRTLKRESTINITSSSLTNQALA